MGIQKCLDSYWEGKDFPPCLALLVLRSNLGGRGDPPRLFVEEDPYCWVFPPPRNSWKWRFIRIPTLSFVSSIFLILVVTGREARPKNYWVYNYIYMIHMESTSHNPWETRQPHRWNPFLPAIWKVVDQKVASGAAPCQGIGRENDQTTCHQTASPIPKPTWEKSRYRFNQGFFLTTWTKNRRQKSARLDFLWSWMMELRMFDDGVTDGKKTPQKRDSFCNS